MVDRDRSLPSSDDEWYALIESAIDVAPEAADRDAVRAIAKRHARQVIERIDAFLFGVETVEWRVSKRLTTAHGRYQSGPPRITLSLSSLRQHGWQRLMQTTRHELVHHWQYRTRHKRHGSGDDLAHDSAGFERWIEPLSITKQGPYRNPRFVVECRECGVLRGRNRASKLIRKWVPNRYECDSCGAPPDAVSVADTVEDVVLSPGDSYRALSDHQRSVYFAIRTGAPPTQRRELITFPGIGRQTATALALDLTYVAEMVDGQTLTPRLREAVQPQYRDALWAEARAYVDWEQAPDTRYHPQCRPDPAAYHDADGTRRPEAEWPPGTPVTPPEDATSGTVTGIIWPADEEASG